MMLICQCSVNNCHAFNTGGSCIWKHRGSSSSPGKRVCATIITEANEHSSWTLKQLESIEEVNIYCKKRTKGINLQGWSKGHQWQRRRSSNHNCREPYWRNQFQHRDLWYALQGNWRRCFWWYEAYAFVKSNWPRTWRRKWQAESKGDILRGASLLISRIGEIENHEKIIFGWSFLPRSV